MKRHRIAWIGLVLTGAAAAAAAGRPSLAEETLEERAFDVRDIVRELPSGELPGGPGDRGLIFNGRTIEDLLRAPYQIRSAGVDFGSSPPTFGFAEGPPEDAGTAQFFLPWDMRWDGFVRDFQAADPGTWRLLPAASLPATLLEHLEALGFTGAECAMEWPRLRVRAAAAALRVVDAFLEDLRAVAGTSIAVEGILVPPEVLDRIAPAWRTEGPFLAEEVFRRALGDPRSRLLSTVARSGQRTVAGSRDLRPLVVDSEVNQTGVIPVNNPVIEVPDGGDYLCACPVLLPGRDDVWVDLSIGRIAVRSEPKEIGVDFGALDFPASDKVWISTSAVLGPGKVLVAGSISRKGGLLALVRAAVRRPPRPAAPPPEGAPAEARPSISRHDLTLLLRQSGRTWPVRIESGGFWSGLPRLPLDADRIGEILRSAGFDGHVSLDRATLIASGAGEAAIRKVLDLKVAEVCELVAIDVEVWRVPRRQLASILDQAEGGVVLAEGWRKLVEEAKEAQVERYAAVGAAGQALGLFGATVKSFAVQVDQVSGGTGFAIIQSSDPVIRSCGDGTELWVQAAPTTDPALLRLTVGGLQARIVEERPVVVTFPYVDAATGQTVVGASADGSAGAGAPPVSKVKKVTLTLPRQDIQCWSAEVDAPPGRDVLLQTDAREGEFATLLVGKARRLAK